MSLYFKELNDTSNFKKLMQCYFTEGPAKYQVRVEAPSDVWAIQTR
jgi:hypothetical protein